jgi:Na+/H+ antiporter NhaD/arsenite permease-like protein
MWMPAPFFALGVLLLFLVQFFVPRSWKWRSLLFANALAWAVLICLLIAVKDGPQTTEDFFEGLAFFGLLAMTPFLLGSIVGTLAQQLVAVLLRKLRQSK